MRQASPQPPRQFSTEDRRQEIPAIRSNVEAVSDRFMDRTIPQAVTMLLREEGGALHVNEIYNRLLEGGFQIHGTKPDDQRRRFAQPQYPLPQNRARNV